MQISILGAGYVGLVTGACFAEFGVHVACIDRDADKVARLRQGEIPIYEPELSDLVAKGAAAGRRGVSARPVRGGVGGLLDEADRTGD